MAFRGDHMSKGIEREKLSNYVEIAKTGMCSQARTQSVPYKQWFPGGKCKREEAKVMLQQGPVSQYLNETLSSSREMGPGFYVTTDNHEFKYDLRLSQLLGCLWTPHPHALSVLSLPTDTSSWSAPGPRGAHCTARELQGLRNIVLSNPKRRNALSLAMLKSLQRDILHEAESTDLKVIIISAEGPVFSSGHDLKELTDEQGPEYHTEVFQTCSEVMMLIQNHPVPVIAMVNGLATAAGCQLVASCDIAVASDKSSFATPGVNLGLFCSTPGVALGRAVPRKVALEMLFTGEPISAQEALLHGMLSRVVPEEQLEEETMRIARKIASLSRPVVSLGKAAFYKQVHQDLRTAYHLASQTMVDNVALQDGQEGIKAFIQKRKPVWSH
ncbi:PREDICTED: enoyl-CoA hydratase domain-containing protein 3, mitochondrial [Myotis brandtii]|nr:PREDICTED: enoyl-CoA hydratase domain-containing protein 3, mitochondrial [Myotis brandtii]